MIRTSKLTVIMSVYNQEQYLRKAIDSVLAQKVDFLFQIIITDDNSTDNSVEIIKEYAEKYPDIINPLYNKQNGRYLKNILRAKEITKTEYFTLLDADDYWTDFEYLQKAVNFLDKNKDFTIYETNVLTIKEDGPKNLFINTTRKRCDYDFNDFLNKRIKISQTTGMVFRNVVYSNGIPEVIKNAVGTISERAFDGDAFRFIMHLKCGKAHFENFISGVYRILKSSIWSRLNDFEKHSISAQGIIDYDKYFNFEYHKVFINMAWNEIMICNSFLVNIMNNNCVFGGGVEQQYIDSYFNALNICLENKKLIKANKFAMIKLLKYELLKYLKEKIKKVLYYLSSHKKY